MGEKEGAAMEQAQQELEKRGEACGMGRKSDKCQGQGRADIYRCPVGEVENCLSLICLEVLCADSLLLNCPDANFM